MGLRERLSCLGHLRNRTSTGSISFISENGYYTDYWPLALLSHPNLILVYTPYVYLILSVLYGVVEDRLPQLYTKY